MAKGNYTALQQLKPTEIKVGELYNKWVDGYVKNGEAERAKEAKMLADQKKSAQEMVAKIDPKIFTTLQSFQPQTNEIFNSILENKAILGRMADAGQLDSNFYNLKAKTDNLASQYLQLSTIVTNPQFLEADKKINEQIQEGDVFEGDENMGRWMSIKSGMAQLKANPNTGNIEVVYNNNVKSTDADRPAKVEQLHEFASNYTAGLSKDLSADIQEKLKAVGTAASTSTNINSNGITTVTRKAFDVKAATNTITQLMGLDPNRPIEEQFTNVNNLTPFAKQYFYKNGRLRFPENGEDLKVLVDDAVNYAKGYADTSYGSIQSKSADEIIGDKLSNAVKRKSLEDNPTQTTNTPPSSGTFQMQVKDSTGNIVGYKQQVGAVIPLDKKGNYIALAQSYDPKTKRYYNSYMLAKPNPTGEIVMSAPMNKAQWESYLRQQGKNPVVELNNLVNNLPENPNLWQPKVFQKVKSKSDNVYTRMEFNNPTEYVEPNVAAGGVAIPQGIPNYTPY